MSTGYEEPDVGEDLPEDDQSFAYTCAIVGGAASIMCTVARDGRPIGSIPCDSIEEAKWFKKKLTGRRSRSGSTTNG